MEKGIRQREARKMRWQADVSFSTICALLVSTDFLFFNYEKRIRKRCRERSSRSLQYTNISQCVKCGKQAFIHFPELCIFQLFSCLFSLRGGVTTRRFRLFENVI